MIPAPQGLSYTPEETKQCCQSGSSNPKDILKLKSLTWKKLFQEAVKLTQPILSVHISHRFHRYSKTTSALLFQAG